MSSKAKTSAAKKDGKVALVPKLRFPKFRDLPDWSETTVGRISETVISGGTPSTSDKRFWGGEIRWMNSGELNDKKVSEVHGRITREGLNNSSANLIPPRCVLIGLAGQGKTRGTVAMNLVELCTNQSIASIFPNDSAFNSEFLYHDLDKKYDELRRLSAGGEGRGGLNLQIIRSLKVLLPSLPEQQKIADCLSSVDELIAAQARKVDALKTHKEGLTQQLFPRDGKTQPRLRFPEFQNGAEWQMKTGGELFKNRKEDGEEWLPIYSVTVNDGMVPRASFGRNFYDIEEPTGNKKVCKGDIAYNTMRMWQGAQGVAAKDCIVSPAYVVLAPQSGVCSDFFAYLFKLPQSLRLLTATSRGLTKDRLRLYFEDFALMQLSVPAFGEQQRIGSCLSSLDQLIAVQRHKLEVLKIHKRGLMQKLFPETGAIQDPSIETAVVINVGTTSERAEPEAALPEKPYKVGFARQLLAAEILQHCHHHPTMGRVKLQKIIHLCEYHAELDDIHGSYVRAAAGPFDNKLMRGVAKGLEKQKWFKQIRGEKRVTYEPMVSSGQHSKYLQRWSKQLPKIREVIKHFLKAKTLSCEIASTLYAAWNDLLIEGRQPTDEEIIREASDPKRWHESKANIDEVKWPAALNWMRENGLAPRGYGAHTTR